MSKKTVMEKKNSVYPKIIEAWSGPGKKDGNITKYESKFDALHINMKQRGNTEWWYFDARLDNGYVVVGFFRAKHERTGKTGVEIVIYTPNNEKIQKIYDYNRSDFIISGEKADIRIGKNYIKVDDSNENFPIYEVFLDEKEYGFHLRYTAQVGGWMPGRGYTEFGKLGQFGWVVPLPRAKVEGTIKVDNKTISVKGIGYHDHNWINFNLVRVVKYWYWGRLYSDNFTLIYALIQCNKKMKDYAIKVLMLAKGEKIILSTGEYDLLQENFKYDDKAENNYPQILNFKIPEGHEITLSVQNIIDSGNLLFELSPLLRFIAKNLLKLKPSYFRFNSKFNVNINYEGNNYKEQGTTLHEMVKVK